jgi:CBS domain-containing protein
MKVKDIMTRDVDILPPDATLKNAAERMERLDVGFLPIADAANRKLQGVITDRDLAIRGLAHGLGPDALAQDIESKRVLYCFEDDSIQDAADSMRDKQVYRLIVLDNRSSKQLVGVVSLGDITRHDKARVAQKAAEGITAPRH